MTTTEKPAEAPVQSAAAPSPFPPIAEYAFLSNCHTGALIAPDGAVDWLCVPSFDSPSVFGSLLDREAGFFRFGPYGINHPTAPPLRRRARTCSSRPGRRRTAGSIVRDALTMGPAGETDTITPHTRPPADDDGDHMLVRTVECVEGNVEVELVCEPAFDYGRTPAEWTVVDDGAHAADATGAGQTIRLVSDLALGIEAQPRPRPPRARGRRPGLLRALVGGGLRGAERPSRRPTPGIEATIALLARLAVTRPDPRPPLPRPDPALGAGDQGPHLHADRRHGRGADDVAAGDPRRRAQLGLPLHVDARHDVHVAALHFLNLDWEADEFIQFVADVEPTEDGSLQIMYGIDGRRDLTESTRDDMTGYAGARPVRIGNGAFDQRQNDVFGAVLDSILQHTRESERLPRRLWPIVQSQAECATKVWREPDQGIWEARGAPQALRVLEADGLGRARPRGEARGHPRRPRAERHLAGDRGRDPGGHPRATGCAPTAPCASTTRPTRSTRRRCSPRSSASCRRDDERLRASVLAIANELTEDGFVLRYRTDETDDGLSGKEGTFLICSFWLVSAFAVVGEIQKARDLMERLLRIASPLGLYAEEFDAETGRFLGNFPQAFSHLALIEAAARIIVHERLEEV